MADKKEQELNDYIKSLKLDDVMELPEDMRREVLKRQLASGAGPLRFMMSRTPMGFLRQNIFNMAGKMLSSANVGNSDKGMILDVEDLAKQIEEQRMRELNARLQIGAAIAKQARIRQSNDQRFDRRVKEANEAGEQAPRRTFMDIVTEQIIPGSIYAKSNYYGADQFGRPLSKKEAEKREARRRDR